MRALYALLLFLYPASFRRKFRAELLAVFDGECSDPRHAGTAGRMRMWRYLAERPARQRRAAALRRDGSHPETTERTRRAAASSTTTETLHGNARAGHPICVPAVRPPPRVRGGRGPFPRARDRRQQPDLRIARRIRLQPVSISGPEPAGSGRCHVPEGFIRHHLRRGAFPRGVRRHQTQHLVHTSRRLRPRQPQRLGW